LIKIEKGGRVIVNYADFADDWPFAKAKDVIPKESFLFAQIILNLKKIPAE
jgi:hypothetical protein